jgi:vacuolar-type H+-ATPase subunit E/Vma4
MSLQDDFYDLAYELALIANKKKKEIEKQALATIEYFEKETDFKIRKDLKKLEDQMMYNDLFDINMYESERIAEVNRGVAIKKDECIQDFIVLLKKKIVNLIKKNRDKYYNFLFYKIAEYVPIIDQSVSVFVNRRDLDDLDSKTGFGAISNEMVIDKTAGFLIVPEDKSFQIEYTVESQIERCLQELMIRFMNIFPVFEVNIKSAFDFEKEQHGGPKNHD